MHLAANIFAQALHDRGFAIEALRIQYPHRKVLTPYEFRESVPVTPAMAQSVLGISLTKAELSRLLERMGYAYTQGRAHVPFYRQDILHSVDVLEDVAISYGYARITPLPLASYTTGEAHPLVGLVNTARDLMLGIQFQEVMSPILSNKAVLYEKTSLPDPGTIEIKDYMSETFSVVRTWLVPLLLDILAKNRHEEYPQRIFEQGLITTKDARDFERLAAVSAHEKANYTEMRQVLDALLAGLGATTRVEETDHPSFIPGRAARVTVNGATVALVGEIHPRVLAAFGLEVPVAAFELNLTELNEVRR